jgi:transposase
VFRRLRGHRRLRGRPACRLARRRRSVHRADARKVKAFIRSFGTIGKTDAIDAKALARYGSDRCAELARWQARDRERLRLQGLVLARRDMVRDRLAYANRRAAPGAEPAQAHLDALLASFDAQIKAIDADINVLTAQCQPIARAVKTLVAIKGMGAKTATALIALMPELGSLARRQAAALAGLAPTPDKAANSTPIAEPAAADPRSKGSSSWPLFPPVNTIQPSKPSSNASS